MVERDRQERRPQLRVRWLEPAECGASAPMPVDRRWDGKIDGTGRRGREMVRGGDEVFEIREFCR